jgi:hypothetical protein
MASLKHTYHNESYIPDQSAVSPTAVFLERHKYVHQPTGTACRDLPNNNIAHRTIDIKIFHSLLHSEPLQQ